MNWYIKLTGFEEAEITDKEIIEVFSYPLAVAIDYFLSSSWTIPGNKVCIGWLMPFVEQFAKKAKVKRSFAYLAESKGLKKT